MKCDRTPLHAGRPPRGIHASHQHFDAIRALAFDARQTLYGMSHEFSVHWTRSHSLFDGPRMRYQHVRACERGSQRGVDNWRVSSKRHVKPVALAGLVMLDQVW